MAAKKHTFDVKELSSAIDNIIVQGSKVFINFSGNEKTYEFSWKPANRELVTALEGFVKNPESFSLGRFYNCLLYTSPSPRDMTGSRMPSSA